MEQVSTQVSHPVVNIALFLTHGFHVVLDPRYKLEWYNTVKWRKEWITNARAAIKKVWKDKYKPTEDECQEVQEPAMSPFLEAMNKNLRKRKDEGFDELGRYFVEQTETVDAIEQLSKENNGKDGVFCWWKVKFYRTIILRTNDRCI